MTDHPITDAMLAAKAATGHSVFGPSSAHRWMVCPGSLIPGLIAGDRPTKYSAEGTVAHWVAEKWLTEGEPYHLVSTTKVVDGFEIEISEDMLSHVSNYVAAVSTAKGDAYTEVKVDLSQFTPIPDQGGTADHIHASWGVLDITDLKYGMVRVHAERNKQGLSYALGAFERLDWLYNFQRIKIRIFQPRLDHDDEWECSREELIAFGEEFREAAVRAWDPNAPRRPDPHACEYCPIRTECPAKFDMTVALVAGSFDDGGEYDSRALAEIVSNPPVPESPALPLLMRDFETMPLEALERLYAYRKSVEGFFSDLGEYLLNQAEAGADLRWWKTVVGRAGRRNWRNYRAKNKARDMLLAAGVEPFDLFSTEMASPYQASKLLRIAQGGKVKDNEAQVYEFTTQTPGRLTLAPNWDAREAIASAASAFDDLPDDD
jgi:hypothetical protein